MKKKQNIKEAVDAIVFGVHQSRFAYTTLETADGSPCDRGAPTDVGAIGMASAHRLRQ